MLIKNGTVVNASGTARKDIRVKDGRIAQVEADLLPRDGEEVLDAAGCLVAPEIGRAHV